MTNLPLKIKRNCYGSFSVFFKIKSFFCKKFLRKTIIPYNF